MIGLWSRPNRNSKLRHVDPKGSHASASPPTQVTAESIRTWPCLSKRSMLVFVPRRQEGQEMATALLDAQESRGLIK